MFEAKVKVINDTKHINIKGKIDMANANQCTELIEKNLNNVKKIVLNLAGLSFIDSTGIGSLVTSIKSASEKKIKFEIINIPEEINEIFEIIGVYEVLQAWNRI